MIKPLLQCPNCGSHDINKNGATRHGNQNYKCRDCGRQFVENPKWRRLSDATKATLERMLLEKLPLAGIARSLQLRESWLQQYVNDYYSTVAQQVQVQPKQPQRLTVQMDELWSFVDDKGNEQWVWLALDVQTRD
jgi:insertion element IS1 protein InsB